MDEILRQLSWLFFPVVLVAIIVFMAGGKPESVLNPVVSFLTKFLGGIFGFLFGTLWKVISGIFSVGSSGSGGSKIERSGHGDPPKRF